MGAGSMAPMPLSAPASAPAERLPAWSADRAVLLRAEQIKAAYKPLPQNWIMALLGALIVAIAMSKDAPAATLALWFIALCAAISCSLLLYIQYRRAAPSPEHAGKWGWWLTVATFISGSVWGSAGIVMFRPELTAYQMVLTIGLFLVVAIGGLTRYTPFIPLVYAFAIPAILPLLVRSAMQGDFAHLMITVGGVFLLGLVLYYATFFNRLIAESINLRFESQQRLHENERLVEALAHERDRAAEANRAKSRFLAAASHDLRQPLHALGLFAAQLRSGRKGGEQVIERIEIAIGSMNELFNALLDIAKLDAGVVTPNRSAFPIAPLLARIEANFAEPARQKGLRLTVRATTAWVASDTILLERVLLNLVSNAVRHTDRDGVLVGCRRRGDTLRLEVYDTGPGIAEDQRKKIFGEFYQITDAERQRRGGLGLGL